MLLAAMLFIGVTSLDELQERLSVAEPLIDDEIYRESIIRLIEDRLVARHTKNWKESDRIRDELLAKGIVLKDGPTGTTWEVKR